MTAQNLPQPSTEHDRDSSPDQFDVAVVGGGQAGLAIGHRLVEQGRRCRLRHAVAIESPASRMTMQTSRLGR